MSTSSRKHPQSSSKRDDVDIVPYGFLETLTSRFTLLKNFKTLLKSQISLTNFKLSGIIYAVVYKYWIFANNHCNIKY
jgi:hypothetical protein